MKAAAARGPWHRLDLLLARLRRHREPLTLLVDAAVVALCWNATYLFRLGFERWFAARAGYDTWVMAGVVAAYVLAFWLLRVPKGLWRFSGFGEVQRFALACLLAGGASAAVIMAAGLVKIPRSVLALHPVVTLMGLALVRMSYRMLYEHLRSRIAGPVGEVRRAVVLGAGSRGEMAALAARLTGQTVCTGGCTVFPEGSSVSLAMEIFVNGQPRTVLWGSNPKSVAGAQRIFTLRRGDKVMPTETGALLPGDRIEW